MGGDGVEQVVVQPQATAASLAARSSINGWNASKVCIAPLKLIDRGKMSCRAAAWAMIVRMRL